MPTTTTTTVDKAGLGRWLGGVARSELGAWLAGVEAARLAQSVQAAERQAAKLRTEVNKAAVVITHWPASFAPCTEGQRAGWVPHGMYPPCWRVATESGGDYGAYNPGGCGGTGCFGKWQFSAEWAGKLGLPGDLRSATPAQQDGAAASLWNGGRGCLNWDAC